MSVLEGVHRDLAAIRKRAPHVAESTEAALALALAAEIDSDNSATSKSMCASVVAKLMADLRASLPEEKKGDGLDDLTARRLARLAGGSASSPAVGS